MRVGVSISASDLPPSYLCLEPLELALEFVVVASELLNTPVTHTRKESSMRVAHCEWVEIRTSKLSPVWL